MRLRALAAVAALLAATAACGGSSQDGKDPHALRMTIWTSNEAHLKLFNDIAAEYKKTHPDITEIRFDPIPVESYTTTLTTQLAGGNAPDLAWILESSAPDFVASGALAPLTSKIENSAELVPSTTKLWQKDGELYAYPFSTSPFGVFVNTDALEKAGQKSPRKLIESGEWTWEKVAAVNAAVAAKGGNGLVIRDFDYKNWDNLASVWTGWGARAWSEDGKTCGFNSPEMTEAMTFLHKAIFTDKAVPGPGTTVDFFAGDAAMTITQISRASLLKDAKFGWDLVPLPSGPKGEYSVIGQGGLGVLKKSGNAAAAADFLAFFTNRANSAKLAAYFPPPRSSQLNAETLAKSNPLLKRDQLDKVVVAGIGKGVVKPSHTGQAELAQTVRAELDPLWRPGADVRPVLDGVCAKIQPLLGS
ncbi:MULTISPECIES: ABC transporter substrate-binding protein [Actinomadura]|uniref:Carbohydrate ABC transporter substrate-binding protein, CUT1 family n=1 Tax=Actinomadura madurae TaxID=1993 RepID=A0A1I5HFZ9_9ACTN|nr:sugar ABC transporter substrate-binding protein [Actinomadura madurae]SFO46791.1 carbohydrate ABC transporter substrate-binding protein, CUT1 family [Actinomadura madurae]SPT57715.1 Lactose-binding protein precursor [Actinomadura madurae]